MKKRLHLLHVKKRAPKHCYTDSIPYAWGANEELPKVSREALARPSRRKMRNEAAKELNERLNRTGSRS